MKLIGFSLIRNGNLLDYSFVESLQSMAPICEKIHVAVGKSDDDTLETIKKLNFIEPLETQWDENLKKGGLILSQQTNLILNHIRKKYQTEQEAWGLYLQADELIHERDHQRILSDIIYAQNNGYDAVRFRYFHFWLSHCKIAISKRWYPQEIRAVKLKSNIESWGDAQGFRHFEKVYQSDAFIYHYGHVREADKYEKKKQDFLKLYIGEEDIKSHLKKAKRNDSKNETLAFWGPHPKVIHTRIQRMGESLNLAKQKKLFVKADKDDFDWSRVRVEKIFFNTKPDKESPYLNLKPMFSLSKPPHMKSKLFIPWPKEWQISFKLFELGIGLD